MFISIHALRGEGDNIKPYAVGFMSVFQSTPSVGRATITLADNTEYRLISIHALRGEGDCKNIQICNAMLVHSAYKTIYFCDSCAFYLT